MMKVCVVGGCSTPANRGGRFCDEHDPFAEEIKELRQRIARIENAVLGDKKEAPDHPVITPARELVANHWQSIGSSRYPDQPSVNCVLKRDAEILAWWENKSLHCETCVRLMRAIREADRTISGEKEAS